LKTNSGTTFYYGRLFPPAQAQILGGDEERLTELGRAMCDPREHEGKWTVSAGYTYFGQFIDHDLTRDRTPLEQRNVDPASVVNQRTPWLDLDNVYGGGPTGTPRLFEGEKNEEQFGLGRTQSLPGSTVTGKLRDLPREKGWPILADPTDDRNVENLIVLQLQVLFMKLHNEAIRQLRLGTLRNVRSLGDGSLFEKAKRLTIWTYQRLVRRDFCFQLLDEETVVEVQRKRNFRWSDDNFFIPVEFSLAAFRFGHAMVRNSYALNCHGELELEDMIERARTPSPLREDSVVEWGRFFPSGMLLRSGDSVPSHPIDTSIASALHHLPKSMNRHFASDAPEPPAELAVRTLWRGARALLPSGQEVARELKRKRIPVDVLTEEELTRCEHDDSGAVLKAAGLAQNTPLFYYVLREAETRKNGRRLGSLGSRLVAEVIEAVLDYDRASFVHAEGFDQNPPLWLFPEGESPGEETEGVHRIDSMFDLVRLVGNDVPQGCLPLAKVA
jgi:hypothetical protein